MKEYSLADLFAYRSNDVTSYENQVVVILYQTGKYQKSGNRPVLDPYLLHGITAIQRNPSGQIYLVHDLQSSLHFAVPKQVAEEIAFRIKYFFGKDDNGDDIFPDMEDLTNGDNFTSSDKRMMVINKEVNSISDPIQKCSKLLETACEEGLLDHIQFSEKSRGGEASSPVMQFGWTQTDCNQYSENRINSVGSIGPFVCSSDCNNLSVECKSALIECIDTALRSCPKAHETFCTGNDETRGAYRERFNVSLDLKYRRQRVKNNKNPKKKRNRTYEKSPSEIRITCEAFTIIIPLVLSPHRDVMNDGDTRMNSVVQVNARIPLNEKTVKSQSLRNYISANSTDPKFFPCSIILYSRDVCQKTAEKIRKMDDFSAIKSISRSNPKRKKDVIVTDVGPLRMCIGKAVMDTSSFRNPLTIWERDHHLGRKAQAAMVQDYERTVNKLIAHEKSLPENIPMSMDKKFHARISSYELTVLELLTVEERSAYLDNIAEAVKIYDRLQLEYPTEEDKDKLTLEPDVKKLKDIYRENTGIEMSHKKLVETVGGALFWMTGGSGAEKYAHAKQFVSFASYLERIRPGELTNCINDSRGVSKYEFMFANTFPPANYDHLPDFRETFNGPRAKFPASWDKSVSFSFN